jgi:hypothetical protein
MPKVRNAEKDQSPCFSEFRTLCTQRSSSLLVAVLVFFCMIPPSAEISHNKVTFGFLPRVHPVDHGLAFPLNFCVFRQSSWTLLVPTFVKDSEMQSFLCQNVLQAMSTGLKGNHLVLGTEGIGGGGCSDKEDVEDAGGTRNGRRPSWLDL